MAFIKTDIGNDWSNLTDLTQYTNIAYSYKMIKEVVL